MVLSDKQIDKNRRGILRLLISTQRDGIESVIDYLYSSGFFLVPSSRKRHHCWKGGLAQHNDICKATKLYYDDKGNLHNRKTHIEGHGIRSI